MTNAQHFVGVGLMGNTQFSFDHFKCKALTGNALTLSNMSDRKSGWRVRVLGENFILEL